MRRSKGCPIDVECISGGGNPTPSYEKVIKEIWTANMQITLTFIFSLLATKLVHDINIFHLLIPTLCLLSFCASTSYLTHEGLFSNRGCNPDLSPSIAKSLFDFHATHCMNLNINSGNLCKTGKNVASEWISVWSAALLMCSKTNTQHLQCENCREKVTCSEICYAYLYYCRCSLGCRQVFCRVSKPHVRLDKTTSSIC